MKMFLAGLFFFKVQKFPFSFASSQKDSIFAIENAKHQC